MPCRHLLAGLVFTVLLLAAAHAHPDHERTVGSMRRADGVVISVVEHYFDGIIADDPVAIHFRLPDGSKVTETGSFATVAYQWHGSHVDVYEFPDYALPLAHRVSRFDGYQLTDATSPLRLAFSPFRHLATHWGRYLLTVAGAAVYAGLILALLRAPFSWSVRGAGMAVVLSLSPIYLLGTWLLGISPLVVAIVAAARSYAVWCWRKPAAALPLLAHA